MNAVTSNAVAISFNNLGESVTKLGTITNINQATIITNITYYKQIAVMIENTESTPSAAIRLYSSKLLQSLYNVFLHDTVRFDNTYQLSVRYQFLDAERFVIRNVEGGWTLKDVVIYGIN